MSRKLFRALAELQDQYNPKKPWIDKTPGTDMYTAIPDILDYWPAAKFIFAKRRSIENIMSRIRKFPNATFESHCSDWVGTMAGWRSLRSTGVPAIEIDQYDVARDPDGVANRLKDFLRLPESSALAIAAEMKGSRPEAEKGSDIGRTFAIEATGWTAEQIAMFKRLCSEEMSAFGYSYDAGYFAR